MTSSIRIARYFPSWLAKTCAIWEVYGGILKYIINYLAHYHACLHKHDDAKKCRYLSVTNSVIFSYNLLNCFHMKYYKKNALPWIL